MLFGVIETIAYVLSFMIITRSILSMVFPMGTDRQWVATLMHFLYRVTEPILAPIRRLVYRGGSLDFSPMIAVLLLFIIAGIFSSLG